MNDQPNRVEEINPNSDLSVYGVAFLLTSQEVSSHDYSHRVVGFEFRKWKRGL